MANFRQKTIAQKIAKLVAKIERLPQPLPEKFLKQYEQKILAYAPLISRVKLCEITPLNAHTLKNLDSRNEGIKNSFHNPINNQVLYETKEAVVFLRYVCCDKPRLEIEKAQNELEELKKEQANSIYPKGFSYKQNNGETK